MGFLTAKGSELLDAIQFSLVDVKAMPVAGRKSTVAYQSLPVQYSGGKQCMRRRKACE